MKTAIWKLRKSSGNILPTGLRIFCAVFLLVGSGCAHIGPSKVVEHRLPYQESIAQSWKQQMLLNIVKIRYGDTFAFSEVSQIIDSHISTRTGGVESGWLPGATPGVTGFDQFRALLQGTSVESERPTITYSPQTGSDFVKKLATALPPESILFLLETGYPADLIMRLTVESINGIRNRSSSPRSTREADPEFEWMISILKKAQFSRAVSIRVKVDEKDKTTSVLRLRPPNTSISPELDGELSEVIKLLKLDPQLNEYKVVQGTVQVSNDEIVIQTRPLLRILTSLSQFVDVPEEHLREGIAVPLERCASSEPSMMHICCGSEPPESCFVAVPYRGYWFWIADHNLDSKRTFTYLLLLLAQAEQEKGRSLPLITIPTQPRAIRN